MMEGCGACECNEAVERADDEEEHCHTVIYRFLHYFFKSYR